MVKGLPEEERVVTQLLHIAGGVRSAGAAALSRDLTWQPQVYNAALHNACSKHMLAIAT